jgi:hypothetical protein
MRNIAENVAYCICFAFPIVLRAIALDVANVERFAVDAADLLHQDVPDQWQPAPAEEGNPLSPIDYNCIDTRSGIYFSIVDRI